MIFYGINPVIEVLRSERKVSTIYAAAGKKNPAIAKIRSLARSKSVAVLDTDDLRRKCGTSEHQGVAAEIADIGIVPFRNLVDFPSHLVVLDGIQDPHNFGAALRVCEVFGFRHVLFHKGNSSGLTAAAIKASSGAAFHLNLYLSNLNSALKILKNENFRVIVLDPVGVESLCETRLPEKFCLVIGSEGTGVRHAIKRMADSSIRIPVSGKVQSLNVSCALSAVLYEFSQQSRIDDKSRIRP